MAQHDFDFVMDYLEVRRADTYAQSDYKRQEKLAELDHIAELAMEINENNEITEDDLKDCEDEIQKLTDRFVKEVDGHVAEKEKEILSI